MLRHLCRNWVRHVACLAALASSAVGQDALGTVVVPHVRSEIRIDGEDGDWPAVEPLRLDRRAQLIDTGRVGWTGPEDASAEVRLVHDRSHLYLAIRLLDTQPLVQPPNETWESGDVIELFFDCDLGDVAEDRVFNEDDLQLMLLPFAKGRTWAAIETTVTRGTRQGGGVDRGFTGIRVARVAIDGGMFLEVAIPLHNLPLLAPGTQEIGFNLALGDRDPERESYNYLVWTGDKAPAYTPAHFGRLRFGGPPILTPQPRRGEGLTGVLSEWSPYLLPALCVLLLLFVARQAFRGPLARSARARQGIGIASLVVLLVALVLPDVVLGWRSSEQAARSNEIARWIQEKLPAIESGSLGNLKGAGRDEPFVQLLAGGTFRRPVDYEFQPLAEVVPGGLRHEIVQFPEAGFSIYRYGIPLGGDPARVQVAGIAPGDRVFVVVSDAVDLQRAPFDPPMIRLDSAGGDSDDVLNLQLTNMLPRGQSDGERTTFWGILEPNEEVRELGFVAVQGQDVRLEGISVAPAGVSGPGKPVLLGSVSRLGVPTTLVGRYPRSAETTILPGTNWRQRLPKPIDRVDKVWFLLEAVANEAFRATTDAAVVGRVLVAAGRRPLAFDLRHQIQLFAVDRDANPELQRLGTPGHAEIAYEWEEHDGATLMTPGFSLSLGKERRLEELTIVNDGSYPFRLRSVVLAKRSASMVAEPEDSPLVSTGHRDEVRLADEVRARVAEASFALFRERQLSATSLPDAPPNLKLPSEVAAEIEGSGLGAARDLLMPDTRSFDTYLPLRGDGWGDAVLAVVVRDAALARLEPTLGFLQIGLIAFSLPWLLVFVLELLASVGSLRLQLTGTIALATVVPLALLFVFLIDRLEQDQREKDRAELLENLRIATTRIDEAKEALFSESRASAAQLATEVRARLAALVPGKPVEAGIRDELRELLTIARPKGWADSSFLALEVPDPKDAERVIRVLDRDESRLIGETSLGPDSSLYLRWGKLFVGARADSDGRDGPVVRSARGRVVDPAWLASWVSRGLLGIYDMRGYPLAVGGAGFDPATQASFEREQATPVAMREKVALLDRLGESAGPLVAPLQGAGPWLGAFSLLRDRGDAPVALLAAVDRPNQASIPFVLGSVGVRPFFVVVGGLLLVLVAFLTLSITDRITRPIERLEGVARRLSRGDLDVEVVPLRGADEVANLNRAFGDMAGELRVRISQQQQMNAAISRLARGLDLEVVGEEAVHILQRATGAKSVLLVLQDRESRRLRVFADGSQVHEANQGSLASSIARADGPCMVAPWIEADGAQWPPSSATGIRIVVPLRMQERRCGACLLAFDRPEPAIDFEFVHGLLGQIFSAAETARLYGLAIEDPATGLVVERYFRRRLAQEVERSERSGDSLSVVRLEVQGASLEGRDSRLRGSVMARLGAELRGELPDHTLAGRVGERAFEVLFAGVGSKEARKLGLRLRGVLSGVRDASAPDVDLVVACSVVTFPEDGHSSEFLVAELDRRMREPGGERGRELVRIERAGSVFESPEMRALLATVDKAATTELAVMIEGETGVGKEVLVDLCHQGSSRSQGPLVKVNCAAIPASLLESELFGHERGAFTGATDRKRGLFEQADRGTLFLDEIGELSLDVQAKLLRVLQDGEFTRVGGNRPVQVDARIVAATHRDLRAMIRAGTFREDLYYRLQGLRLRVPPLRERREEIPTLVEHFRASHGKSAKRFAASAYDAMYRYSWPGNVRELENVVRRALVLAGGPFVEPEDLDLRAEDAIPAPATVKADHQSVRTVEEPTVVLDPQPTQATRVEAALGADQRWLRVRQYFDDPEACSAGLRPSVYCELVGISRRTASRDLKTWVSLGRLRSVGAKRSQRYFPA